MLTTNSYKRRKHNWTRQRASARRRRQPSSTGSTSGCRRSSTTSKRDQLASGKKLDHRERKALASLARALHRLLDSEVPCRGDGNLDGVVDVKDIEQHNYWANLTGMQSSWYDFNLDGFTDQYDVPYITAGRFPRRCPSPIHW